MVKASRAQGFAPSRGLTLRPARARRSREHLGIDSVRSKLPPYVSPSPVSREASRDLWRSIGPSTMVVFKLRTSLSRHPLCPKISWEIYYSCFRQNENYISDIPDWTRQQRRTFLTGEGGGRPQRFIQAVPKELKLGKGG